MSRQLGVHIAPGELRAVRVERRGRRVRVEEAVRAPLTGGHTVEEALGVVHDRLTPEGTLPVGLAPSQADVWLKLINLPPLPHADRTRLLETEAERFFPVHGEPVLVDAPAEGPVVAGRAGAIEAWIARAEEALGPVHAVEPAARGTVRALAELVPALGRRVFAVLLQQGSWWELAIARGSTLLGSARLLSPEPATLVDALTSALGTSQVQPAVLVAPENFQNPEIPELTRLLDERFPGGNVELRSELVPGIPMAFAPAVGLALSPAGGLLPAAHRARLDRAVRRRTTAWLIAACVAAALLFAVGPWVRSQRASQDDAEIARLGTRADSAAQLLERVHRARGLVEFTDSLQRARMNWVGVFAELSQRLPEGAYLTQLHGSADARTLEVRGYAGNASAIVPLLERSERFSGVESTEPITRRTVGGYELENFSVRLRVEP